MANNRTAVSAPLPGMKTPFSHSGSAGSSLSPSSLKTPDKTQTLELPVNGNETASFITKASVMSDIMSKIRFRQSTIYSRRA
eukprot:UN23435